MSSAIDCFKPESLVRKEFIKLFTHSYAPRGHIRKVRLCNKTGKVVVTHSYAPRGHVRKVILCNKTKKVVQSTTTSILCMCRWCQMLCEQSTKNAVERLEKKKLLRKWLTNKLRDTAQFKISYKNLTHNSPVSWPV